MQLFFFNDTATTEIYTLSLHDALPILQEGLDYKLRPEDMDVFVKQSETVPETMAQEQTFPDFNKVNQVLADELERSEEHTSELQSRQYLVCRLLLDKQHAARGQQDDRP